MMRLLQKIEWSPSVRHAVGRLSCLFDLFRMGSGDTCVLDHCFVSDLILRFRSGINAYYTTVIILIYKKFSF